MAEYVNLNGTLHPAQDAHLSIYDHGFLYGDGVFEGIRAYDGRVFRLDEHVARLYRSALALAIEISIRPDQMRAAILETVRANEMRSCYIRVSVSRGVGLGLDPEHIDRTSTIVISTKQLRLYPQSMYDNGLEVVTASTRVPPAVCIDPQIKSLGRYINNILAKMEANRVGAGEALMLNMAGNVAEATGDNLFIIRGGELITPPTSEGALVGITRLAAMEIARSQGIPVREAPVTLYDCYTADEAFLTGTAAEVIPMVRLDCRNIADGKPGPLTRGIIEAFRVCTATEGAPIYD
ncbi:MAG: branched-chain-amino-acid transaminase [Chthonomonadales bacterium]|nr:branched-chain-amino-acid transaminase [Chthonomonadales bacterium]